MSQIVEMVDTPVEQAILPLIANRATVVQAQATTPATLEPSIEYLEATVESALASFQTAQGEAFASLHRSLQPLIAKAKADEATLEKRRKRIDVLEPQLLDMEKRMTSLEEEVALTSANHIREKDMLEAALRSERAAIERLERRSIASEEAERELRERLKAREESFDRCFADWRAAEDKLSKIETEVGQLLSQIAIAKEENQAQKNNYDELDKMASQHIQVIAKLNERLTAETTRANDKELNLEAAHERVVSTLRRELEESRAKLLAESLSTSKLRNSLDELKARLAGVEVQKNDLEQRLICITSDWESELAEKEAEVQKFKGELHQTASLAKTIETRVSITEKSRAALGRALVYSAAVQDAQTMALQRLQLRSSARTYADKQRRRAMEKEHSATLRSKNEVHAAKLKRSEKDNLSLSSTLAAVQEELEATKSELEGTIQRLKDVEEPKANMAASDSSVANLSPVITGPLLISLRSPTKDPTMDSYQANVELSKVQGEYAEYKQRTNRQLAILQEKVNALSHPQTSEPDVIANIRRLEEANRQMERRLRDAVEENVELRERIERFDELETTLKATRQILKGAETRLREAVDENADLRRRVGKW